VRACDYHPFTSPWRSPVAQVGERVLHVSKLALTGLACDTRPGTLRSDVSRMLVATADEWLELRRSAAVA